MNVKIELSVHGDPPLFFADGPFHSIVAPSSKGYDLRGVGSPFANGSHTADKPITEQGRIGRRKSIFDLPFCWGWNIS